MSHNMYHKEPKLEAPNSDYATQQHQRGMHQRRTHLPQSSLMEQIAEIARNPMNRSPEEMREHFLNMKAELGNIRERIKNSPALDSLRETQQLQLEVVQEQLRMKQELIQRLKDSDLDKDTAMELMSQ
ncbi:Oidioi.mRNA.OKI2018_I69.chr1.g2597.t1.cds [Oikopleura dioica]|uniref:Mediator of RNA polymerase II transcription subunit 9 n=1 Tax=Oikopleura dioica TaxID=34765 RepID=A0ABN7SVX1_OIKDI|nr:Oidioi.mRNA.OKI2018_I69.chr1.g2597.t1.cds [Oikopleura dioica]